MIFLPRDSGEAIVEADEGNRIVLKAKQITTRIFEVTSPSAKSLSDYEKILDAAMAGKSPNDLVFQAVDWLKKRNCAVIITESIEQTLRSVPGGVSSLSVVEIKEQPYRLTSDFVTDRFEFEGLADLVASCVKNDDLLYLCFDWAAKKNLMLWSTKDPSDRQKCLRDEDIYSEAA